MNGWMNKERNTNKCIYAFMAWRTKKKCKKKVKKERNVWLKRRKRYKQMKKKS